MADYIGWDDYKKRRSEDIKHKGDLLSRIARLESLVHEHHQQ